MILIVIIIFSLVSIVVSFFSPLWSWIILALPSLFLIITFLILKQQKWSYVPELSPKANEMIRKFGHFYNMPFAAAEFSGSASALMIAGIILAIIDLFHKFWLGIAIGAVNYFVMAFLSRAFNPSLFLFNDEERSAHKEIISFIQQKKNEISNIPEPSLDPAEWKLVIRYSDGTTVYFNTRRINYLQEGIVEVWNLSVLRGEWRENLVNYLKEKLTFEGKDQNNAERLWYVFSLYKINCRTHQYARLEYIAYSFGETVLDSHSSQYEEWNSIPPGSVIEDIEEYVCKKHKEKK